MMKTVVIIGGGLSGTLVAIQLLLQTAEPLHIQVVERSSEIGRGVAYSTPLDCHLLNLPVNAVSTVAADPNHFLRWLHQQGKTDVTAQAYVSRRWFGSYVQDVLAQAIQIAPRAQFETIADEAIHAAWDGCQAHVHLRSGRILRAHRVVLALGNPHPSQVAIANPEFYQSPRYIPSGWAGAVDGLLDHPSLLLLGAGLTAVDWIVALQERHYQGTIHTLSRHGLLPQPQRHAADYAADWLPAGLPQTARGLLHWVRQEVKQAAAQGYDWRAVLDTLWSHVRTIWVSLPLREKQRFVRHLRPYWDSHRHRVAPEIGDLMHGLQLSGQLRVHTAWLHTCRDASDGVEVSLRRRGDQHLETLTVGAVINCTGPQFDYCKLADSLIHSLLDQGIIRPDPLALGIDAAGDGAVISAAGLPSPWLYTLGPTLRGNLWETTAVTDIRNQAIDLAQTLLAAQVAVAI